MSLAPDGTASGRPDRSAAEIADAAVADVRAALARLDGLDDVDVDQHAEVLDDVHRVARQALTSLAAADPDRSGPTGGGRA